MLLSPLENVSVACAVGYNILWLFENIPLRLEYSPDSDYGNVYPVVFLGSCVFRSRAGSCLHFFKKNTCFPIETKSHNLRCQLSGYKQDPRRVHCVSHSPSASEILELF